MSAKSSVVGGNSSVLMHVVHRLFFSDFFPSAMALQSRQGCLPSKVCVSACARESRCKLPASIEVQASDCKKTQCNPMEQAKASTSINLHNRVNTIARLNKRAASVKGCSAALSLV